MRGVAKIPISAANRKAAGVAAGDEVDVEVELDLTPREVVVPVDFAAALRGDGEAERFFEKLSPSRRQAYVTWIEQAKQPETRERRINQAVTELHEGRQKR